MTYGPMKYTPIPIGVTLQTLAMCECGAIVASQEKHNAFHELNDKEYLR